MDAWLRFGLEDSGLLGFSQEQDGGLTFWSPFLPWAAVGIESRGLHMPDLCSFSELHPQYVLSFLRTALRSAYERHQRLDLMQGKQVFANS